MDTRTITGRRKSEPELQNIPVKAKTDWPRNKVAAILQERRGSFNSFMVQMRQAQESANRDWQKLLANGWVEVAPGVLHHPDRPNEEILNG